MVLTIPIHLNKSTMHCQAGLFASADAAVSGFPGCRGEVLPA
jgi:hypothetical protein